MSRRSMTVAVVALAAALMAGRAGATPSTNIWNPSTDIQAAGVFHLGIDNYFSIVRNKTTPLAFPTDVGLTYGLGKGFEIGVDVVQPLNNPFFFNAKWGMPEKGVIPAFAVGIQSVGTTKATQSNIIYGVVSKNLGAIGRLTAGPYKGKKSVLVDETGSAADTGVILAWDKAFTDKWWASVDYASGDSAYGALAFGGAYKFAPNVGLIVGYVVFNNNKLNVNDTVTTQLDIDF